MNQNPFYEFLGSEGKSLEMSYIVNMCNFRHDRCLHVPNLKKTPIIEKIKQDMRLEIMPRHVESNTYVST